MQNESKRELLSTVEWKLLYLGDYCTTFFPFDGHYKINLEHIVQCFALWVAVDVINSAHHDVSDYSIGVAPGSLQFWCEVFSQTGRQNPYESLAHILYDEKD